MKKLFAGQGVKKTICFIAIFTVIFSLSSCASKQEKAEKKAINSALEYIEGKDYESAKTVLTEYLQLYPDSEQAKKTLKTVESYIKEPTPTLEKATNKYYEMRLLYNKWFERADISYRKNETIQINGEKAIVKAYRVNELSNKKELDEIFLKYCTQELYDSFNEGNIKYHDNDGKLYVSFTKANYASLTKEFGESAEKVSDDDFVFSCYKIENNTVFSFCTQHLSLIKNQYRFTKEEISRIDVLPGLEKGTYFVEKADGLDMTEEDNENSDLMITLPNGTKVECYGCIGDYAYICYDNSSYGFVKAEGLVKSDSDIGNAGAGSQSKGSQGNSGKYNVGDLVNDTFNIAGYIFDKVRE